MKKRPTGITIIAFLFMALGVLSLLWSGLVFGVGGLSSLFAALFGSDFGNQAAWSGMLGLIAAGVKIATGFGLLRMKSWGWYLAILSVGLSVIEGIFGMFGDGVAVFFCGALGLLIPVGILIYLLQEKIRLLFGIQLGR